ncbi:MAG: hypothetical protein JWM95_381 [Gemmatimonadetes bacterium]|nr:hypothetical protein [Gemmatimonadota bacterium]
MAEVNTAASHGLMTVNEHAKRIATERSRRDEAMALHGASTM